MHYLRILALFYIHKTLPFLAFLKCQIQKKTTITVAVFKANIG